MTDTLAADTAVAPVVVENVTKSYSGGVQAVRDVSLTVHPENSSRSWARRDRGSPASST